MFNKDKVKDVAKLAMIEIDDQDLNFYSEEIINFLKLVEQTENIDLSQVEPLFHAPDNTLNARDDVVDKDPKNDGINSSPSHNGNHFIDSIATTLTLGLSTLTPCRGRHRCSRARTTFLLLPTRRMLTGCARWVRRLCARCAR